MRMQLYITATPSKHISDQTARWCSERGISSDPVISSLEPLMIAAHGDSGYRGSAAYKRQLSANIREVLPLLLEDDIPEDFSDDAHDSLLALWGENTHEWAIDIYFGIDFDLDEIATEGRELSRTLIQLGLCRLP